jgi:hypothetical protein
MVEPDPRRRCSMNETAKKTYEAPKLTAWGSVVSLTHVGNTNPGGDCFGGSVYPPGHDDGCPPAAL